MSSLSKEILSASRRSSGVMQDPQIVHQEIAEPTDTSRSVPAASHFLATPVDTFDSDRGLRKTSHHTYDSYGSGRVLTGVQAVSASVAGGRRQSAPASAFPDRARGRIGVECEEALAWINATLRKSSVERRAIIDVRRAFADGVTLPVLLEIISGCSITGVHARPILRMQRAENLKICLQFLTTSGVKLQGIKPDDLVNGQLKSVLSLCSIVKQNEQMLSPPPAAVVADSEAEATSTKMPVVTDQVQTATADLPGVTLEEDRTNTDDGAARRLHTRSTEEVLRPVRQSSGTAANASHDDHQPDIVPVQSNAGSIDPFSPSKLSPSKSITSLGRRVTEAWGAEPGTDEGSGHITTIKVEPTVSAQQPAGAEAPKQHQPGSGSGISGQDWTPVSPLSDNLSPHSKGDSDSAFATDSNMTSPSSTLNYDLQGKKPRSQSSASSHSQTLADGVISQSSRQRFSSQGSAAPVTTTAGSRTNSSEEATGSPSHAMTANARKGAVATAQTSSHGLRIADSSSKSPLTQAASSSVEHSPGHAPFTATSWDGNLPAAGSKTTGTVNSGGAGMGGKKAMQRVQMPTSPSFSDSELQTAQQSRQQRESVKTTFDSSPEKQKFAPAPAAMSPSAFVATPPHISGSSSENIHRPQPIHASPDNKQGTLSEVHHRLSTLEAGALQWQKERAAMHQQMSDQQRLIAALYQQGQTVRKKASKERTHWLNTIVGLEAQLVEFARFSAATSSRLCNLEAGAAPHAEQPVSEVLTESAATAALDLEEELHRARRATQRLEMIVDQQKNGNRTSMSSLESMDPVAVSTGAIVSTPKLPGLLRVPHEVSIVATSSTPIDSGVAASPDSNQSNNSASNITENSCEGSYDRSFSHPSVTAQMSAVKVKKFFGQEPPHLLRQWLNNLGYEYLLRKFEKQKVGMLELPYLTETQLKQMKIPAGPRMRILHEVQLLRQQVSQ